MDYPFTVILSPTVVGLRISVGGYTLRRSSRPFVTNKPPRLRKAALGFMNKSLRPYPDNAVGGGGKYTYCHHSLDKKTLHPSFVCNEIKMQDFEIQPKELLLYTPAG